MENSRRWQHAVPFALVVLVSIALRALVVAVPLERDEGEYAYIADRWLAGELPYRDAFDQKPPAVFVAYLALFACGFKSVEAIHWLGHAFVVGTMGFVFLIARRLFSASVAWNAALATALLAMDAKVLGNASNTEVFAILPLAAAMYLTIDAVERGGAWRFVLIGALSALSMLFKQVTLPVVVFLTGWIAIARWRDASTLAQRECGGHADDNEHLTARVVGAGPTLAVATAAAWYALGFAAPLAATAAYFAARGAWQPFYDCVIGHNVSYSGRVPLGLYLEMFGPRAWEIIPVQLPLMLAAVWGVRTATQRRDLALRPPFWWFIFSAMAVSVGGYFRPHYFLLVMPPLAVLAAYGLDAIAAQIGERWQNSKLWIGIAVALPAFAWPIVLERGYYFASSPDAAILYLYSGPYSFSLFVDSPRVAAWIRERTGPDDTIFIHGSEPQILFYTGRRSATRYIFLYPLYGGARDAVERQAEVLREVESARPKFILTIHRPGSFSADDNSPTPLADAIRSMIERDYVGRGAMQNLPDGSRSLGPEMFPLTGKLPQFTLPRDDVTLQVWERRDAADYTDAR